MEKLSEELRQALEVDWFTREEISWIQESIADVNGWRVYNEEEMQEFIEKNIYAKYRSINV